MEQVKLALQSYKEKHGDFPPSGPAGNNRLYYYLSGEAELMRSPGLTDLTQLHSMDPGEIKKRRMDGGIKNLLPNLKEKQFDKTETTLQPTPLGPRNLPLGNLYSPLPDETYPEKGAPWIYESGTLTHQRSGHNRETYDLSVKIWDKQKDKDGVLQLVLVKEIGNW
jgi:hypothetical protein